VVYRSTQIGWLTAGVPLVFFAPAALVVAVSGHVGAAACILAMALVVVLLFGRLTVTVDSSAIRIVFGHAGFRRTLPVAEVRSATPGRSPWWAGWGIRLVPRGFLYIVAGRQVVEIELSSGRRVLVGTDDPEGVARAIAERLA